MAPSRRHQSSLEGVIDFYAAEQPFSNAEERDQAIRKFRRIVGYFEALEPPVRSSARYNRPALVRLTFEYARSPASEDKFLNAFFRSLALGVLDESVDLDDDDVVAEFRELLFGFADFLVNNFFLPIRTATNITPQPSPVYHARVQQVQRVQDVVGTPGRFSALRRTCLVRDRHRCVITRAFDVTEAKARWRQLPAKDDDGNPLGGNDAYGYLEVAHIIPCALTKEEGGELNKSRKAAIAILNMLDNGIIYLIEGSDNNRSSNAITLGREMHQCFGHFDIFFKRVADTPPNTYQIQTFLPFLAEGRFPITRTLFAHPSIDPPSERLLALHSAMSHILHLSGAGDYVQAMLNNMETGVVQSDGSTQLGVLVGLALRSKG
ncbi:hypothetical protein QBC34DRAFT_311100 [Podospora aff. communis PSN243]|uniref:HNH nuclease domain-containing protein n=1 Tax=Podospora aff. communis PSN243 TaxID=3040156 RepID=A0AAV9G5N1_9PEZI|nr:hypothetical protein QBC34DRAFT_311100 [Podospora aff. communis PSN243]